MEHPEVSETATIDTVAVQSAPWPPGRLSRLWRGYAGRRSMIYRLSWELVALLIAVAFILALMVLG